MTEPLDLDALCTFCANLMASDRTENETRLITGIAALAAEVERLRVALSERSQGETP